MKKVIVILFFTVVTLVAINEKEKILIPSEAIRFRVIANSDSNSDQLLKLEVKNEVEKELYDFLKSAKNISEARDIIKNNLNEVDAILKKYDIQYDISYGNNYFPKKEYKGITYSAGTYESLVITLGSGLGKNWWCVLFPPLCLLDEDNNLDNNNYELYVKKLINNFNTN